MSVSTIARDLCSRRVSARPLAALRIVLPLVLLVHLIWVSDDVLSLHGGHGIIPWELTDLLRDSWVPGLPTLANALSPLGISEHAATTLLLSVYAGSLLALALGLFTRFAAFLAWALHVSLVTGGFASYYGVDQLANTFLFYLLIFPSDRAWQLVPRRTQTAAGDETIPVVLLRVMQLHLCVIYLAAGVDKAMGIQWWNGEAIWQTVSQPIFSTFDSSWLANHSWIAMLAGWSTIVVEVGYAFFIWPRRTRAAWALAAIGFHVGTCLFMGLVFFSSVMILLTVTLFLVPEQVPDRIRIRSRATALASLVVVTLLPSSFGRASRPDAENTTSKLANDYDALVLRLMARDQIPGVAVGVVDRGRLVFARGFGYRDIESRLRVTPDTLFPLGSCSKAFTATAIALLADEGRIDLDAPVRTYLPDFALADPIASATVTTRDLLTHRTGLPRHDLFWYRAPFSRDELYERLRFLESSGPAHDQWRYNSLMFVVAGRVVEKVSGETWESYVHAHVLVPLDMRRTRLSAEATDGDANHAVPYGMKDGVARRMPMLMGLGAIAPAGGVQTSLNDLARWLTFHATRSPALLSDAMWSELHRPQAKMPKPEEPEIEHPYYGLGWIHESYRGHPLVVHNGAIDGFTVHLGFLPETGQGLIILTNRDLARSAVSAMAYSAYDRLLGIDPIDWESRLHDARDPPPDLTSAPLDFSLESVVGTYEHPAYGAVIVRSDGDTLAMQYRDLHLTLMYRGDRKFISREPITDGAPQISARFSEPKNGEPLQLFVPFNFDDGDPVEVFTRVRS